MEGVIESKIFGLILVEEKYLPKNTTASYLPNALKVSSDIYKKLKKCKEKDLVKVLRSLKPNMKFYGEVLTTLRSVPKLND